MATRAIFLNEWREDSAKSGAAQLVAEPEALGDGKPLFRNLTDKLKLNLIEATALKAGDVFLRYRPATITEA